MERVLVIAFSLIFAISAQAATPGPAPIITIAAPGSQTQALSVPLSSLSGTGVNGVYSVYAYVSGGTSANYYWPLYKNGAAWQVGSGVTAHCFNATASAGSANSYIQIVWGTGTFTGSGSGTAPTGALYQGGLANYYPWLTSSTANVPAPVQGEVNVPASYYGGLQVGTASTNYNFHMDCYEQ